MARRVHSQRRALEMVEHPIRVEELVEQRTSDPLLRGLPLTDYRYVTRELRRVFITIAALLAGLLILWAFLR